jgi:hypothetical protein
MSEGKNKEIKDIMGQMKAWAHKNNQHGKRAFQKYMMLLYLEGLQKINSDFVFKGGNLLWHYIQTPRETVDLDLATLTLNSHLEVRKILDQLANLFEEVVFTIKEFKEIKGEEGKGATLIIEYKTLSGQKNQFTIDIIYSLPTDLKKVKSTISKDVEYLSASIENIICDKVSTSYRFKGGNTRMKDFDDLWRLSQSKISVDTAKLKNLFEKKSLEIELKNEWISDILESEWERHTKKYKDLPTNLEKVFEQINHWLKNISK